MQNNFDNTQSSSARRRQSLSSEHILDNSPRYPQFAAWDGHKAVNKRSGPKTKEKMHNTTNPSSDVHILHSPRSTSSGHILRSNPRFQRSDDIATVQEGLSSMQKKPGIEMPAYNSSDPRTEQNRNVMNSYLNGRALVTSSAQSPPLSSGSILPKSPRLSTERERAGTNLSEQEMYSPTDPQIEQNFQDTPSSSSQRVPYSQRPVLPTSGRNSPTLQMHSAISVNSEWKNLSESEMSKQSEQTTQNQNTFYYNTQLNESENRLNRKINNRDQQQQLRVRESIMFEKRRHACASSSPQRFNVRNFGINNICGNDLTADLLPDFGQTKSSTSFVSQTRQVSCAGQKDANLCKCRSNDEKMSEEITTEHYEEQLQELCDCRLLDEESSKITGRIHERFLARLQDIDNVAQGPKDLKLITAQEWVNVLLKINHSILTNMEELESEVVKRMECELCKIPSGYRLNQNGELLKCRHDINALIKIIQNAYHHNNWNFEGIIFETLSPSQVLGVSVPNTENLRAEDKDESQTQSHSPNQPID